MKGVETTATVLVAHKGYKFDVRTEHGHVASCYVAGKLIKRRILILPGDNVAVELSPYDLTKGRIIYRL